MSAEDNERRGRSKEVVNDENIKKIYNVILKDCMLKMNERAGTPSISSERVHHTIDEYFGTRKLRAKWMPRDFTFLQKLDTMS